MYNQQRKISVSINTENVLLTLIYAILIKQVNMLKARISFHSIIRQLLSKILKILMMTSCSNHLCHVL